MNDMHFIIDVIEEGFATGYYDRHCQEDWTSTAIAQKVKIVCQQQEALGRKGNWFEALTCVEREIGLVAKTSQQRVENLNRKHSADAAATTAKRAQQVQSNRRQIGRLISSTEAVAIAERELRSSVISTQEIADRAALFREEERKAGRLISFSQAVAAIEQELGVNNRLR